MHPAVEEYVKRFSPPAQYKIERFYTQLHLDEYHTKLPYLCDIENFCLRLYLALLRNDRICIYSDYDTDAVTATATMYWGLIELGFLKENLSFYAPDRFTEGYGMNPESIRELAKTNDLIISVDCGINSVQEAIEVKKARTCDLIITDHHHLAGIVPDAVSVINPRLTEYYASHVYELEQKRGLSKPLIHTIEQEKMGSKAVLEPWIKKMNHSLEQYQEAPERFLSQSATGVGVAWFCVVWLGYFLEEMNVIDK
jgi:uncharacterized protein YaiI (UPF0178 family)